MSDISPDDDTAAGDEGGRGPGSTSPQNEARRYLGLPDPEDVRRQRESAERTYTKAEVKAHLRSLGE